MDLNNTKDSLNYVDLRRYEVETNLFLRAMITRCLMVCKGFIYRTHIQPVTIGDYSRLVSKSGDIVVGGCEINNKVIQPMSSDKKPTTLYTLFFKLRGRAIFKKYTADKLPNRNIEHENHLE